MVGAGVVRPRCSVRWIGGLEARGWRVLWLPLLSEIGRDRSGDVVGVHPPAEQLLTQSPLLLGKAMSDDLFLEGVRRGVVLSL